jgi:hypothetical protein
MWVHCLTALPSISFGFATEPISVWWEVRNPCVESKLGRLIHKESLY